MTDTSLHTVRKTRHTTGARRGGVAGFIARHPLTSFFAWFFTVGQAFAFAPLVADTPVPPQVFIVGSTLIGLLLPTLVITRTADGPDALRALWHRAVDPRAPLAWYAFVLLVLPLVTIGIAVAFLGLPQSPSSWVSLMVGNLLLPLVLTWLPNNWWEEVAWAGFVQARLQDRRGPWLGAVITGVLFALQHISLVVDGSPGEAVFLMTLLIMLAVPFRFVTGWMVNRTGSLFLVGLVHGLGDAVATGSGFQSGLLARLYPDSMLPGMAHLLAFALIGLIVVAATRGLLGLRRGSTGDDDGARS
jgi:membrane protease YdiL (CAAX protease family)